MFCKFVGMPRPFPDKYTFDHELSEDGSVSFECSQDSEVWPWLNLAPTHPILIQTVNFWASFDSGVFLDEFKTDSWTALTHLEWTCGRDGVGLPARGAYAGFKDKDRARYTLQLFDKADDLVCSYSGQGVTFRTRNFEGWRDQAKQKLWDPEPPVLDYVAAGAVGVAASSESFLSPLQRSADAVVTTGLITKENGLRPNHPFIGGSGDHVNSTHMGEIARQFGCLLLQRPTQNRSGEMRLKHYVELGVPFEVALLAQSEEDRTFTLMVRQADRDCAEIDWVYA